VVSSCGFVRLAPAEHPDPRVNLDQPGTSSLHPPESKPAPSPSVGGRAFKLGVTAILLVALVVRVGAAIRYDIEPETDALDYDRHAVSIAEGAGYPEAQRLTGGPGPGAFRPPLYPFLLGGVYAVAGTEDPGDRRLSGRLAQALLGTIAVGLIALIALQIWGRVEALVAGAIAAVYPPLVLAGSSLLTEPAFIVLMLAGLSAMLRYRLSDARLRWLAIAGACAGLATLGRTNGVILIAVFAFAAWTLRPRWSRQALMAPAVVLLAAAVMITPWTIRNAFELNAFVPVSTQAGFGFAGQYNEVAAESRATWLPPFSAPEYRSLFTQPGLDEVEVADRLTEGVREYVWDHPEHVAAAGFWNGLRFLSLDDPVDVERRNAFFSGQPQGLAEVSVYAFWLMALIALAGCFTSAARRLPHFIWVLPPLFMLSVMFVFGMARYRVVIEPIVILLGAIALVTAWQRFRAGPSRSAAVGPK
jgi:4-amino-4-deoxy-L-arabinose transferase-like glycosyltransferase